MIISNIDSLNQSFRALHTQAKTMLEKGKMIEVVVSEKKTKRSNDQNAYYFLINKQVADFLNDSGLSYGEFDLPYTSEIIHEIQKKVFGVKTTTKMTVGEFCEYENKVILFWQERTGYEWQPSEMPASYLVSRGYDFERNLR